MATVVKRQFNKEVIIGKGHPRGVPPEELTLDQRKIFQFIRLYVAKFSKQPSYMEMAKHFKLSKTSIQYHIWKMEQKGWVKTKGQCRGLWLYEPPEVDDV